jgi:PAS domain S-box-containing protein
MMIEKYKILHIEDLPADAEIVKRELNKSDLNFSIKVVDSEADYITALEEFTPDVILCDHSLPSFNSLQALKIARLKNLQIPFLLLTATMSEDVAMSVIRIGADDYILKDRLNRLPVAIKNGIEKYRYEKERRDYLEILSANEMRFRALVENGVDAIVIFNIKGKPTYVSPSVPRILGYTEAEIKQIGVYEFLHPDDRKKVATNMKECLQKPGVAIKGYTVRIKHKHNGWRWVEPTLTNMLHDPAIDGIIDNFHDVTERVISTQSIKDNELRLADAQTVAKVGSWETDLTDFTVNWSAETYRILDLLPDNLQNSHQRFLNFIHPEDKQRVDTAFRNSFESKDVNTLEHRVLSKDGAVKYVEERWRIIRDNEGKAVRASGTIQDITERKKAEQAVIENEAFTAGLIDSLSSNIAVVNGAGTIIKVNRSWNTFAFDNNASSSEKCGVGANYFEVCSNTTGLADDFPALAMDGIKKVLSGASKDFYLEYPCHSPIEERWFYMRVKRFDSNEPLVLIEHQYITERKKAEELVLRSEAKLNAIIENTDAFIYSLDREFRYITFNTALKNRMQELYGITITPGYCVFDYIKQFEPGGESEWMEIYSKAFNGETVTFEKDFVIGDIHVYTSFSIHPMWENEKVIGLSCFVNDITKAKEAEEAQRKSDSIFRQIVETAQEGIWVIDENNTITFVNDKMCEILGYSQAEVKGKKHLHFKDEDGVKEALANIERRKQGITETLETSYISKSGQKIWASVATNPIFNEDGEYKGALSMISDITTKRELRNLLDRTSQLARIGSWQVDLLDNTLFWSAVTKELHEVDQNFIPDIGTAINFYKEGDNRNAISTAVQEGVQNGTPFDLQLQIVTAKGNERWVRAIGSIEYVNNVATKLNGSFQDIDTAKKAELEIVGLFKEKNSILESIGDAFFAVDKNWKVTYWNTKAEVVLHKKKETIINKNLWEEFADAVDSPFYSNYRRAAEENRTMHFEAYYDSLDIWFEVSVYPSSSGLSVYFRNINQSKKAEAALKESEKRYRQIVETAQEGIWLVDEHDKTIFVNSKLCEILGYDEEEILGKEIYQFIDEESQEAAKSGMKLRKHGESGQGDFKYRTKAGTQVTANISANPIFDDDGKYIGALAMVTDITEKVKLQKELQEEHIRSQHELMKAVVDAQEKERAGIGAELHDNVNQLLATSRLYINICIARPGNNKESLLKSQEYVSEAIEELRRLSHALVGPTQDRIMGLVPSIQDLILDVSNTKNINIDFNYSTFREERNEVGLKLVVYRIVQEQINNVLKHANASEIKIDLKKSGKDLVLIIQDNGKGFDTAERRKGIGLQNIHNRAKLYDGTVQINSSPGKGCEMIIKFKNHAFGVTVKAISCS